MPSAKPWEFWVDVGGTFTDCLAQGPDGPLLRHKLLSSGATKGAVGIGSSEHCLVDEHRQCDPNDFWVGFRATLLDVAGEVIAETSVESFDNSLGALQLADPVPLKRVSAYELSCDLEAPVLGIRYLLELPLAQTVPPLRLRLGTTRGTNALLTRTGARTALATTRGFGDLLQIGYQDRPQLFELSVHKPTPLAERVLEINERMAADGTVLEAPDPISVRRQLEQLRKEGVHSLAICLLHADLYPAHEQLVERIAAEVGFGEISRSSAVAPLVKIVARGETTVVDAYLTPVLSSYVAALGRSLPGSQIRLMTSAGGLVGAEAFRGHQSVLSGPAGGVIGVAQVARAAGFQRAIGFDMGGTSTDVSRFDGHYQYEFETRKAGVRLVTPTLAIDTVAAGGGSICQFDGTKLTVGPASAGADPGPACYGRGGPLCVTDLNLFLGRIAVERFPFALDQTTVEKHLLQMAQEVAAATGEMLTSHELAEGLLQIANANIVRAVRGVSVAKGADPSDYALVSFGGAGPQHACAVSRELGIASILNHPDAGILSAYGIGQADVVRHAATGVAKRTDDLDRNELETLLDSLAVSPLTEVAEEGIAGDQIEVRQTVDVRYEGTDAALNIPFSAVGDLVAEFETAHRHQFGYLHEGRPLEIVAARVEVVGKTNTAITKTERCVARPRESTRHKIARFDGREVQTSLWDRDELQPGDQVTGPAIVADQHSTIVVELGWHAEMLSEGELLLVDQGAVETEPQKVSADAVMLEVFNNLLAGVAEQMGYVLRRTAGSVNVKERLDYSCAVFTASGELVANAPHVPVHLGAMGASVRAVLAEHPQLGPGDVFITNDPYRGGSHLPDITVVTPVHERATAELLFFAACRAHHAEIGGVRPGSMPPNSRHLGEEGVVISNFTLVKEGVTHEAALRQMLLQGPYPSRSVEENLADIRAQVAANQQGARELLELVERYSLPVVEANMRGIQGAAEAKVRKALANVRAYPRARLEVSSGRKSLNNQAVLGRAVKRSDCAFTDYLETATGESVPISVSISFPDGPESPAAVFDFTGTAPVLAGNLNANRAIVTAAVLYVLRLLVDEDIPLNEGALRAVEIVLPNCLLNPSAVEPLALSPAVAAGNVETSQRVVDVLLGALGVAGASQGTMNNVLFGNEQFGYYETICGGSGATADGPGADAVQVHMTNTRSTDPEVLERRHPVRLLEFSIRPDSGGAGHHRGGHGAVRRIEFLEPLELSLITQRRGPHPPYGMNGGLSSQLGKNHLRRHDGSETDLAGICELTVEPGDVLTIETPGGGGYGVAE